MTDPFWIPIILSFFEYLSFKCIGKIPRRGSKCTCNFDKIRLIPVRLANRVCGQNLNVDTHSPLAPFNSLVNQVYFWTFQFVLRCVCVYSSITITLFLLLRWSDTHYYPQGLVLLHHSLFSDFFWLPLLVYFSIWTWESTCPLRGRERGRGGGRSFFFLPFSFFLPSVLPSFFSD